jgi:hypothetical protein
MNDHRPPHKLLGIALMLMIPLYLTATSAQTQGQPEHFTANAVDLNSGRTGLIEISITRWSTDAERLKLQQVLFKKGQDALVDELRDMRSVGRIYTPGSIGYDLRFARQRTLPEGGREIIIATDRPMSFRELWSQPRSVNYPFTWAQFTIGKEGVGDGKLAVAARITGEEADDLIEVEDFAIQPVRLQNIKARKGK